MLEARARYNTSRLILGRSRIDGTGLFASIDIEADDVIAEYSGEVVGETVCSLREKYYEGKGIADYMFRVGPDEIIDATLKGCRARYVNHSCDPNCFAVITLPEGGLVGQGMGAAAVAAAAAAAANAATAAASAAAAAAVTGEGAAAATAGADSEDDASTSGGGSGSGSSSEDDDGEENSDEEDSSEEDGSEEEVEEEEDDDEEDEDEEEEEGAGAEEDDSKEEEDDDDEEDEEEDEEEAAPAPSRKRAKGAAASSSTPATPTTASSATEETLAPVAPSLHPPGKPLPATLYSGRRVFVYAQRRIRAGEELTYDYQFPADESRIPCKCGAANCRGTLNKL
jgi:flagellar biosynthesis GTPase FlhF